MNPVWLPDGSTLLFSSDRNGEPFTIHAVDVNTGAIRRMPAAGPGAHSPALSPDGRRLVFVGYSADGYDLYSIPFSASGAESTGWEVVREDAESSIARPASSDATAPPAPFASSRYTPWPTLVPHMWFPIVGSADDEVLIGAGTTGFDALGRHNYIVNGAWSSANRPFWDISYAYSRFRPSLFVSVSEDTDAWRAGEVRSRDVDAGIVMPVRRVRWSASTLAALHASRETFDCPACETPVDVTRQRRAMRFGASFNSSKSFGYSISAEEGGYSAVATEFTRTALGADGNAGAFTVDVRRYIRVFPGHAAVAVRVAGAASWGDDVMRRVFSASGSGPRPLGFAFGGNAIGLMRGFEAGDVSGTRAAVANIDYRFPLLDVQRGVGTVPVFLRQIHAAAFADFGKGWEDRFDDAAMRRSLGAELPSIPSLRRSCR